VYTPPVLINLSQLSLPPFERRINCLYILPIPPTVGLTVLYLSLSPGCLLADDPQGETPLIPAEVMDFSISHSTEVDINTTLQIMGSPGEKASSIPGFDRTDTVVR
jgi:hypothetical protein